MTRGRAAMARLLSLACLSMLLKEVRSFNLDPSKAFQYSVGQNGYYFGYSLAFHQSGQNKWILAGAPQSDSSGTRTQTNVGALYRCSGKQSGTCVNLAVDDKVPDTTKEVYENQWLGANVVSQGPDGRVVVCAPRYGQRIFYSRAQVYLQYTHGRCFLLDKDLQVTSTWNPYNGNTGSFYQSEAGFSIDFSHAPGRDLLAGVIGYNSNRGTVLNVKIPAMSLMRALPDKTSADDFWGYSVVWANMSGTTTGEIVGGAPRGNKMKGKLIWYALKVNGRTNHAIDNPDGRTGSYFGATVCAVDLNNDNLDELIVGAPYHSNSVQEGQAYVFMNNGAGSVDINAKRLSPETNENALFGSSIAAVGDLNLDGYQDIAIGAPYGGKDGKGAVYIYHGGPNGLKNNFEPVQTILAAEVAGQPSTFGSSITGGMDMDDDGSLDIAIGSYKSDRVHLIRGRPIIVPQMKLNLNTSKVAISTTPTGCVGADGKSYTCVNVQVCLSYGGSNVPNQVDLEYVIDLDKNAVEKRAVAFDAASKAITSIKETISLPMGRESCKSSVIYVTDRTKNLGNTIVIAASFTYTAPAGGCTGLCPVLDFYGGASQEKQIAYFKGCGSDDICNADLGVTGKIKYPPGENQLVFGKVKEFSLDVLLTNTAPGAENALLATIEVVMSSDISVNGVELETGLKPLFEESSESPLTKKLKFEVSKVFAGNQKMNIVVKLAIVPTRPTLKKYQFTIKASTVSEDSNSKNDMAKVEATAKALACLRIAGSTSPKELYYKRDEPLAELPYKIETEIGPEVSFTFLLQNQGPSTVLKLGVVISVASQLLPDLQHLVYLLDSKTDMSCSIQTNPDNIKLTSETGNNGTNGGNNRRRRDVETIGCRNGKCTNINCIVDQLPSGSARTVTIRARVWKRTFIEVLKEEKRLFNRIQLSIPPEEREILQHQSGCAGDGSKEEFTFYVAAEDTKKTSKESIPWWIILVSVLVGLLLIAGAVAALYKAGFFKRDRVQDITGPSGADNDYDKD